MLLLRDSLAVTVWFMKNMNILKIQSSLYVPIFLLYVFFLLFQSIFFLKILLVSDTVFENITCHIEKVHTFPWRDSKRVGSNLWMLMSFISSICPKDIFPHKGNLFGTNSLPFHLNWEEDNKSLAFLFIELFYCFIRSQ